jgi:hypothetical protein
VRKRWAAVVSRERRGCSIRERIHQIGPAHLQFVGDGVGQLTADRNAIRVSGGVLSLPGRVEELIWCVRQEVRPRHLSPLRLTPQPALGPIPRFQRREQPCAHDLFQRQPVWRRRSLLDLLSRQHEQPSEGLLDHLVSPVTGSARQMAKEHLGGPAAG